MTESDIASTTDKKNDDPYWGEEGGLPEVVSWKRVALGLTVMTALHALLAFAVFTVLFTEQLVVKISLGVLPYLLGGLMLGFLARGDEKSLLDPFYASLGPALVFPFIIELMRVYSTNPPDVAQAMARVQWLGVLAPVLIYVIVALFACWLGERLRGIGAKRRRGDAVFSGKV